MTKEEQRLLEVDLSARLPYGVVCYVNYYSECIPGNAGYSNEFLNGQFDLEGITQGRYHLGGYVLDLKYVNEFKPYLRSIDSLTNQELEELGRLQGSASYNLIMLNHNYPYNGLRNLMDFIYSHHIDYLGLIPKDLALEAPEGMYEIK